VFDVVVPGGGLHGLSTAWHLSRDRGLRIAVVEQFPIGHRRGSSHGSTRLVMHGRTTVEQFERRRAKFAIG
jgi:sarcosine oxidase